MSDSLFNKIADELEDNTRYLKRVNLYRDGEPLLDRKLPERISILKSKNIPNISISTNASLLTSEKAHEILSAGIDMVTVSVDSLKKDIYEQIRRGLVFEEVLSNVQNFIKLRNNLNSSCEIWIRMIRQQSNHNEFPDYEKYWSGLGTLNDQLDRIYYHNVFDWGGQLDGFQNITKNTEVHLPCVSLWSLMPIFASGVVPMCNVDYNANHEIGNINHSSIKEVWQSSIMNDIRNKHLSGNKFLLDMCKSCNVWEEVQPRDGSPTVTSHYLSSLTPSVVSS